MSEQKLKPCPFCGGTPFTFETVHGETVIRCRKTTSGAKKIFCATISHPNEESAFQLWNSRPTEDALRAENQRLREALEEISKRYTHSSPRLHLREIALEALKGGE